MQLDFYFNLKKDQKYSKPVNLKEKKVYLFKVALKHRKGLWRKVEIRSDQTLGDFDSIIRKAFDHDTFDHLSEFYLGRVWRSVGLGEINPFKEGPSCKIKLSQLDLKEGDKLEYVYDFGDDIQHIIILEKISSPENKIKYPRIIAKNRPKYLYCVICKEKGKKERAKYICIECSYDSENDINLCENCLSKGHEDHENDELYY